MTEPIKVKSLCFCYESKSVLNDIKLSINRGEFVSIIGPNGSGKTTLLKHIANLIPSKKSIIWINEKDISLYNPKSMAKIMAVVPQQNFFEYSFSAFDIVMMGRHPHLDSFYGESQKDVAIVEDAMKQTDTLKFKNRPINALSGGERQRVILARAIAQDAEIMLLDEPITFLDIHHQIDIIKRIKTHAKSTNKTVVAVLHDLNFALKFSDKIILLKEGEILSSGKPAFVLTSENLKLAYDIDVALIKKKEKLDYIMPII